MEVEVLGVIFADPAPRCARCGREVKFVDDVAAYKPGSIVCRRCYRDIVRIAAEGGEAAVIRDLRDCGMLGDGEEGA